MWIFREPRQALSWLQPKVKQIGRIALFVLALRHAGYLALPLSPVMEEPEIFYWSVYFYPALVVLWGLWKAHQAIGWSMLWFLGLSITMTYAAAMTRGGSVPLFGDGALSLFVWGLVPFDTVTFLIIYAIWFWDKRLPAPDTGHRKRTMESGSKENRAVRFFLLGGTVLFMFLGLSMLLLILYRENPVVVAMMDGLSSHGWRWSSLLIPEDNLQEGFAMFHIVSLMTLASLLFFGVWCRQIDIIEAGCWLLVPGQTVTVAWPPWQPFMIAATLTLLLLCVLALWHHGFPMVLRQTRRGLQGDLRPSPRKAGED